MNAPFTDAPQAAESQGQAADRPERASDRPVATAQEQAAERVPGEPPAPVHVPYARTGVEPDVVSAPVRGGPRRPARSPFWAAVRSHVWLGVIVIVLVGGAATAYWGLRVHQRIGEATLERGIQGRENASTVRCVEQQSNGAVWACGLVYTAESLCLIANVNPAGDWTTKPGVDLCTNRPELTALLPPNITPGAVEADLRAPRLECVEMRQDPDGEGAVGVPGSGGFQHLLRRGARRALGALVARSQPRLPPSAGAAEVPQEGHLAVVCPNFRPFPVGVRPTDAIPSRGEDDSPGGTAADARKNVQGVARGYGERVGARHRRGVGRSGCAHAPSGSVRAGNSRQRRIRLWEPGRRRGERAGRAVWWRHGWGSRSRGSISCWCWALDQV